MKAERIWMGLGLYTSYLKRLPSFVESLSNQSDVSLIIADEPQRHNQSLNNLIEKERISNELFSECNKLKKNNWEVYRWNSVSQNPHYQELFEKINQIYETDELFRSQNIRLTKAKRNVSENHPNIHDLTKYVREEIAGIIYFAEKDYIKAGHQGERDFDKLALKTVRKYSDYLGIKPEKLKFIYLDKTMERK